LARRPEVRLALRGWEGVAAAGVVDDNTWMMPECVVAPP